MKLIQFLMITGFTLCSSIGVLFGQETTELFSDRSDFENLVLFNKSLLRAQQNEAAIATSIEGPVFAIPLTTPPQTSAISVKDTTPPSFDYPIGIAFSPNGKTAYVANKKDNLVSKIDLTTYTVTETIQVGASPAFIAINAAGTRAYVTNSGAGTISIINLQRSPSQVVHTFSSDGNLPSSSIPTDLVLSSDGQTLYVINANSAGDKVTSFDISRPNNPKLLTSIALAAKTPNYLAITPATAASQKLYVSDQASNPGVVYAYSLPLSSPPVAIPTTNAQPAGMTASPDGIRLFVANLSGIDEINIESNQQMNFISIPGARFLTDVAITSNGNTLYATDADNGGVYPMDLTTNPPTIGSFIPLVGGVFSIAIPSD